MLNQFMDDVISKGAEAVLPINLENEWIAILCPAALKVLTAAMDHESHDADDSDHFSSEPDMMLIAATMEIYQESINYSAEASVEEISDQDHLERLSCYSLCVLYEAIRRAMDLGIPAVGLEHIFDTERISYIEAEVEGLSDALAQMFAAYQEKNLGPDSE